MYESVFFVSALTANPIVHFDSEIDSGYSVDNLEPTIPSGLVVEYNTGNGNTLTWNPSEEPDVQYYRVYRSFESATAASSYELVAVTAATTWVDPDFDGWPVDYRVTAVDHSGNESGPSGPSEPPTGIGGIAPKPYQLRPNTPNPFNGTTTIGFDAPSGGGRVRVAAYDVRGRLVRTLLDEGVHEGYREIVWDGLDSGGSRCASGIYFVRLTAPGIQSVRKVVIAR
jgi:hypothetical protein